MKGTRRNATSHCSAYTSNMETKRDCLHVDASVPYHTTGQGKYSRLPCQPAAADKDELRVFNTAVLHATDRLMINLCGGGDTACTPEAIANTAGQGVWRPRPQFRHEKTLKPPRWRRLSHTLELPPT